MAVLVANRGEIAVRVAKTLREMDLRSIAVYTPGDDAHVSAFDEAHEVPSYLDMDALLAIKGVKLIHPGYGFLSENAAFSKKCGKKFIGPGPDAIKLMGDKHEARASAEKAGVPVIPGTAALGDNGAILKAARKLGLPVMLKAAAGGGGKGMRRIEKEEGLDAEIEGARREARQAFGDDRMLVEKILTQARHVEIQLIADQQGNVVALGERECSLQRRFQKIIEEAPSSAVDADLRRKMEDAACSLAKAVGYVNAGTVEFLLRDDGTFAFLEMNTRLQVEHPVTEYVTGVDLVRLQIEVAQGRPLALERPPRGHAIEARIYAENPHNHFLPTTGRILRLDWPEGIRVDTSIREGMVIGSEFDPMIAKMIAFGPDRDQARRRLVRGLRCTVLLGIQTNVSWLADLLETPDFQYGQISTDRLPEVPVEELPAEVWAAALGARGPGRKKSDTSPWDTLGRWRVGE